MVRNDVVALLDGEGAEGIFNGLYVAEADQFVDNHMRVEHIAAHCASHELYKGILDGRARGVFNGRIFVHKGAQKTDAKQTNRNLLLSRQALVNSNPQLEIFADDVRCTHGSTVGQLDAEAIFYLRSRGIGEEAAKSLLTYAFASEVSQAIDLDSVRHDLEEFLFGRLAEGDVVRQAVYGKRSRGSSSCPSAMSQATSPAAPPGIRARPAFDVEAVRRDFPILAQRRNGKPLVFLDSAASAQKPRAVLDAIDDCYQRYYANVHRGVHWLSQQSTEAFEEARETVAALPQRARRLRDRVRARHHRGRQPGGVELGPPQRRARRRGPHLRARAPLQPGAVAGAVRRARRAPGGSADRRSRRDRARGARAPAHRSHAHGRRRARLEQPRHHQPGAPRSSTSRTQAGALVLVDGAQAAPHLRDRRPGAGLRLLRVLRAQGVRPDRDRRAVGPHGAARRDAALPVRRRDDPHRHVREDRVGAGAAQVRGGHARHRGRGRPVGGAALHRVARSRRGRRARGGAAGRGHAPVRGAAGHPHPRHRAPQDRAGLVRHGRRARARPRHHPRPGRDRGAHRPSLRAAGDEALRRRRLGARLVRALQHARRGRGLDGALDRVREVFG